MFKPCHHAGINSAAAHLVRHHHTSRRQQNPRLFDHVLPAIQTVTNVDNWPAVQLSAYVTGAAAVAAVGHPMAHPLASTMAALTVLSRRHAATALHRVAQLKPALVRTRDISVSALPRIPLAAPQRFAPAPYSTAAMHKLKHGFASCTHSIVGASSSALRKVAQRGNHIAPRAVPHAMHASGTACSPAAAAAASALVTKLRPLQAGAAQAAGHAPAAMCAIASSLKVAVSSQKRNVPKLLRAAGALRPGNFAR